MGQSTSTHVFVSCCAMK